MLQGIVSRLLSECLAQARALRHLDLSYLGQLEDEDLLQIAKVCPSLLSLNIAGCGALTDVGIADALGQLHHLESLDISRTHITDEGLYALHRMKHLEDLSVAHTSVTGQLFPF